VDDDELEDELDDGVEYAEELIVDPADVDVPEEEVDPIADSCDSSAWDSSIADSIAVNSAVKAACWALSWFCITVIWSFSWESVLSRSFCAPVSWVSAELR